MRIDLVITELFVGGAERCLTELAIGLQESGDNVRVFSLGALPPPDQGQGNHRLLVERLEKAGIPIASANANSKRQSFAAYRQLKQWFQASRPDICQTFLFHANVLGTQAAKSAEVPLCVGGIRIAESKWLRCQIERRAVSQMHSVVCVSNAVKEFTDEYLGCEPEKSLVIPNAVDVTRFGTANPFNWTTLGWPAQSKVSLFVGRLHPQKGIELLQQQIDTIAPANSDRKLLLVGDGPLRGDLENWADRIGKNRVLLLPWQTDVAPLMRACRILILPSHYEGMPNVVLEAMAAARPVVCSKVEGSSELLSHSPDKQGFPRGDSLAMKNLVEQFLSNEVLCNQIGDDNQARVRNDFSIAAMVDSYRSHYRTLLTRRVDSE